MEISSKLPEFPAHASEFGRRPLYLGSQQSTARLGQSGAIGGEEMPAVLESRPLQCCGSPHFLAQETTGTPIVHGEQSNSRYKANRSQKCHTQTMHGETVVLSAF